MIFQPERSGARADLEYLDLAGAVLAAPPRVVDGSVTARGPGLGMDWDEAAVARYLV